jgi:glucose-6-phosphate-specific signal transduction histidine kinase
MIKDKKRHITDCLVISAAIVIMGILKDINLLYYIAVGFALTCALIPFIAKIISYGWQGIGIILGFFVSKIVLGMVFYFFLFPISILQKLLSRKISISKKRSISYWITKDKTNINFSNPW